LQRTQELDPAGDVVYDRIWFSWPLVFKASNNPSFSNPRKNSSHPIVIIHQCNFAIISTIAVKVNQHNYNQRIATIISRYYAFNNSNLWVQNEGKCAI
jgi:hypothetical protein